MRPRLEKSASLCGGCSQCNPSHDLREHQPCVRYPPIIMLSMVVMIMIVRMMRTMMTVDGTATLPMTHACVKLLPPMPSRSVSSILVTTSPILPSHPGTQDFFHFYSGSGQVLCCFCSEGLTSNRSDQATYQCHLDCWQFDNFGCKQSRESLRQSL